jgi:SAM-dependent MidA family methyltransferase
MELALTHPTEGYYSGADDILGARGHFSTAPILSPEFNETLSRLVEELVEGSLVSAAGKSCRDEAALLRLVELGGGQGQVARSILERLAKSRPDLKQRLFYTMVEVSEGLRALQRKALAGAQTDGWRIDWVSSLRGAVPAAVAQPTVVIGNEFIDALPVHLLDVRGDLVREAWVELASESSPRAAGVAAPAGGLAMDRESPPVGGAGLREVWGDVSGEAAAELRRVFGTEDVAVLCTVSRDGFLEVRPGVGPLLSECGQGGAGTCLLTVDYGGWSGAGRTLRAYYHHQLASDVYSRVGAQDLTADVDFKALEVHGREAGFETALYTTVAAMLSADSGEQRLAMLEREALDSLESDRRATVLRALLDDQDVGGAFKVMVQVKG